MKNILGSELKGIKGILLEEKKNMSSSSSERDDEIVCACDEENDIICAACYYNQSYLIRKICSLYNDEYGGRLVHRHDRLLNEYLRVASAGVLCEDVRFVAYVLEYLARGGRGDGSGAEGGGPGTTAALRNEAPLRRLLVLCSRPPLLSRPTAIATPAIEKDLQELFNALGFVLVTVEDEELSLRAASAVHSLLTHKDCVPMSAATTISANCAPPINPTPPSSPTRLRHCCIPRYIPKDKCEGWKKAEAESGAAAAQQGMAVPAQGERVDTGPIPVQWRVAAAERSNLASTIGAFLEFASPVMYSTLIDLTLLLASMSMKCCSDLVLVGAIDLVLLRMSPEYPLLLHEELGCKNACAPVAMDADESALLWGLLRGIELLGKPPMPPMPTNMSAAPPPSPPSGWPAPSDRALRCLSNCLHAVVIDADIQGALAIVSLILMMQQLFPDLAIVSSGLADDVATLAVSSESEEQEDWTEAINVEKTKEVFELKRSLLLSVSYLPRDPKGLEVIRRRQVVRGLSQLLKPNIKGISPWRPGIARALAALALHVLTAIALVTPQDVVHNGGLVYLVLALDASALPTDTVSTDESNVQQVLVVLFHLATSPQTPTRQAFRRDVIDAGATDALLRFSLRLLGRTCVPFADQNLLTMAFVTLEALLSRDPEEAQRHARSIISVCAAVLAFALGQRPAYVPIPKDASAITISHNEGDEKETVLLPVDDRMVMSALAFMWETVVPNPKNSALFVTEGLVYKLLDVLQNSVLPVQMIGLSFLIDLLEFGNCLAMCITWRGDPDIGFIPLLMKIWRDEELLIKPSRDNIGFMTDISFPMMGEDMRHHEFKEEKDSKSSPAIVDMCLSVRPKIYAIIQLIKHRYKDRTEDIEDMYHIYNPLSTEDELSMTLADNYLVVKLKEVWSEIILDLGRKGINPIPSDFNMMNVLNDKFIERMQELQDQQSKIIQRMRQKELESEANFYRLLEGSNVAEQIDTLGELDTFACITDPRYLQKVKTIEDEQMKATSAVGKSPMQIFQTQSVDPLFRLLLHQNCNMRYRRDFSAYQDMT